MKKILIIQTAFIGDVILATAIIESLAQKENAKIDFLLRKGNETLLENNPHINKIHIWNKKNKKYKHLRAIAKEVKQTKYDLIINLQRFASSGYVCFKSKAKEIVGFDKNPFSFKFHQKASHHIGDGTHEIERNFQLLNLVGEYELNKPKLYPTDAQKTKVDQIIQSDNYVVMAPSSVWFTKQLPESKWVELIDLIQEQKNIFLIGAESDLTYLKGIQDKAKNRKIQVLAGQLNLVESAYLISKAKMTYVNDSAPLHLASAMNAPTTAFFCSTIPEFGFGPLSDQNTVIQIEKKLTCRPCGLHGKNECPENHFDCGLKIDVTKLS